MTKHKNATPLNPKDIIGLTKPDLSLLTPAGSVYEALAMMDGKFKYGPYNWRNKQKKIGLMTYLAAIKRHIDAVIDGEWIDPKSKVPHIGHAKAGCGIIADAKESGYLIDDRPPKGAGARLIRKYTKARGK